MHVLLTGAAEGIGQCLAGHFAGESGATLSLVDINAEGAERTAETLSCPNRVYQADLSDLENLPLLYERITEGFGQVDVLINNAGVMWVESLAAMDWDRAQKMVNLDYLAPLRLINLALPAMRSAKQGTIINVASMAGLTPIPGCGYYSSAKAGIAMASEILHTESAPDGIHVLTVYPGPISTQLEKGARSNLHKNAMRDLLPVGRREDMAERIFQGYKSGAERVIYPDVYLLARHFPGVVYWATRQFAPRPVQ
jgi:short-subunit dehydrogenase